jgi:hypothetical protein
MNTDSYEYDILENAVEMVKDIPGFTCEIGVREGGGTKLILDKIKATSPHKIHIAIDPFGNIEYQHWENRTERLDYTNRMKNRMLKNLYAYCDENDMECLYFQLEDSEFFKRYADGIPIYNEYKQIINQYSLVFLDGPHTTQLVKEEFDFFCDRMSVGGIIVFDDIDQYPHMQNLDEYIQKKRFKIIEKRVRKISYIKY